MTPDIHSYTASKLPWVVVPPGALSVPRIYDYRATWPSEAWERWQTAVERRRDRDAGRGGGG